MNILSGYKEAISLNSKIAKTGVPPPTTDQNPRQIYVTERQEAAPLGGVNPLFSMASQVVSALKVESEFHGILKHSGSHLRVQRPQWSQHLSHRCQLQKERSYRAQFIKLKKIFPKLHAKFPAPVLELKEIKSNGPTNHKTSQSYLLPTSSSRYLQRKLPSKSVPRERPEGIASPRFFTRDESTIKLDPISTYQPKEAFIPPSKAQGKKEISNQQFVLAHTPYDSKKTVKNKADIDDYEKSKKLRVAGDFICKNSNRRLKDQSDRYNMNSFQKFQTFLPNEDIQRKAVLENFRKIKHSINKKFLSQKRRNLSHHESTRSLYKT